MFKWLRGTGGSLDEAEDAFSAMLADARHVFDLAMSVRVGGADPETLVDDLQRTEERTDEAERRIRRLVLVHASVHGSRDFSACLMYMSIAKDAERVADLAKNIFGIGQTVGPVPSGEVRDDFVRMRDEISPMLTEAARIVVDDDRDEAEDFIAKGRRVQRDCHGRIEELLLERSTAPQAAATALTYRHLGRIVAHLLNAVSGVVMPLDRLDYPTRREQAQPGTDAGNA